ncbi:MAG: acyl--CoA ligase [Sandaracinus sp.]|nr:acyl--CoA ligase [Sandaracinus sp.]
MIPPERYDSLGELLRDAFVQYKSETALIELDRKKEKVRLTYLEAKRLAERLAKRFEDAGVGAGDRVAIVMSNQSRWLLSAYAALFRGAVLVPIDFKLTGEEQETLLRHCRPKVLVTEYPEYRDMAALQRGELSMDLVLVSEVPGNTALPTPTRGTFERWEHAIETVVEPGGEPTFVPRTRRDQATLVYSSGTGGNPKGCILTHDNYLEQYRTLLALYPLTVGDRYFSVLPTNHAIDFMSGFVGAFACGATVVHQRTLRPEFLRHVMQEHGITHMAIVPMILEAFERAIDERLEEKGDLAEHVVEGLRQINAALTLDKPRGWLSKRLLKPVHDRVGPDLKMLFVGGAFVDRERAQRFYELGFPLAIGYGLTEACTVLTVNDMKPFRADSVGKPLDGVELEVRGADANGVGEVWVKSRTVFAGYLDDPEQTAEVLKDGWLKTGDLGYLDPSGHLHLVGRSKNMIVTAGGKNVYPEDVESAFEGVDCEELVVYATGYVWPGTKLTDEGLVAVVRAKKGKRVDDVLPEIRRRNLKLADYKRLVAVLPWEDEMPRTASMKVKRPLLAEEIRGRVTPDALIAMELA